MKTISRPLFFSTWVALLVACVERGETPTPSGGAAGEGSVPLLYDGFEGGALESFWRPGSYGSGRYEPGAVELTSHIAARRGQAVVRITVREGNVEQTGDDGKLTERAELDSGAHALLDLEAWYAFSLLLPEDFPVVDDRLVIAQWKQSGLEGGPLVAQRFRGGEHTLTIRTPAAFFSERESYALPELVLGRWHDMLYHVRFSTGDEGLVEVWMNGERVVEHAGPNAFVRGENGIYNKVGLYRDRWPTPMTIIFDEYALGPSRAAVEAAPSAQAR